MNPSRQCGERAGQSGEDGPVGAGELDPVDLMAQNLLPMVKRVQLRAFGEAVPRWSNHSITMKTN